MPAQNLGHEIVLSDGIGKEIQACGDRAIDDGGESLDIALAQRYISVGKNGYLLMFWRVKRSDLLIQASLHRRS